MGSVGAKLEASSPLRGSVRSSSGRPFTFSATRVGLGRFQDRQDEVWLPDLARSAETRALCGPGFSRCRQLGIPRVGIRQCVARGPPLALRHHADMRTTAELPADIRPLIVEGRDAWLERDYVRARSRFEEALTLARRSLSRFGEVSALHFLGNLAFNECRDDESRRLHAEALDLSRLEGDDQGIATSLVGLALVDVADGERDLAAAKLADAESAYERAGMPAQAASVRATAQALVVERVPLQAWVHRQPCH